MLDIEGVESPADLLLLGTEEVVLEGLERYVEAGITDFRIGVVAESDDERSATRTFLERLLK